MKITFHIGAHRTDEDRLMRTLIRNNQILAPEGICVPGPSRFRDLLRDVTLKLKGAPANAETEEMVLDAILDDTAATHMVLSYENFICSGSAIMADGGYYAKMAPKSVWLRNAFPGHACGFAIAIRNPAAQIPAVFAKVRNLDAQTFLAGVDPRRVRWSDAIFSLVDANPDCPVTVWCNEDTPLIWPEVLRAVSGYDGSARLRGGMDLLAQITEAEGMRRLRAYLDTHPPQNAEHRRRVMAAFLDKYAKDEEIEEVIDFAGWTVDLVEEMTADYEADIERVRAIPGVTFIAA